MECWSHGFWNFQHPSTALLQHSIAQPYSGEIFNPGLPCILSSSVHKSFAAL
jgi:hypothetical protein